MNALARLYARLCTHVQLDIDLSDVRFTADDTRPTDDYRPTCGTAIRAVLPTPKAEARPTEAQPRLHPTLAPG